MENKIILVIWLHFIADFVMQSDKVAKNKSSSLLWLWEHVGIYSIPFVFFLPLKYVVFNTWAHFVVDFFTSKATTYLWKKEERHWFFVVIGLDQALHLSCLILTLGWF